MKTGTRREFFAHLGFAALDSATASLQSARDLYTSVRRPEDNGVARDWLRPPGALPEREFRSACTRCEECVTACPYQSIRRLGPEFGVDAGTPAIIPHESPCYLCEDMPCVAACEPGALLPTARAEVNMGLAVVRTEECYAAQRQPCDYCFTRCPLGKTAIEPDAQGVPMVHEEACTGCGVCVYICPADAIHTVGGTVKNQESERTDELMR